MAKKRKKRPPKGYRGAVGDVVEVMWEDASSVHDWSGREGFEYDAIYLVKTYGQVLHSSTKQVRVASSFDNTDKVGHVLTIPREMIRTIRRIRSYHR